MKKLGVVITDGVGFRNFILSDFISEANTHFEEVIIYSCIPATAYDEYNLNCEIIELGEYKESFISWFFRKTKEVAHLRKYLKGNFGINDNYIANRSKAKNIRGYATRLIYIITNLFYSERWILRFNYYQQLSFNNNAVSKSFQEYLKYHKPNLLLFTHQRPPFIAPLIYQAEKLKIKTAAFIFSWDNLASKGRMSGNFNYYLVWSELMKSELLHFYEALNEKQVKIVGTPQFEPYVLERYKTEREVFNETYNLDSSLPVILFTCNDSSSKNDPFYLELIANFIANSKIKANIIVRTSPADEPVRFLYLKEKFPFIRWNFPDWKLTRDTHAEIWTQRVPTFEDVVNLKSLFQYCDVVINVLSTTILDGFLFDKPSICPVFGSEEKGLQAVDKFLNYAHLKYVDDSDSVAIVYSEIDLLNAIDEALVNPKVRFGKQKELIQLEIGMPLKGTSKRIAETLVNWT